MPGHRADDLIRHLARPQGDAAHLAQGVKLAQTEDHAFARQARGILHVGQRRQELLVHLARDAEQIS
jgi:hypothetical protein